LHLEWFRLQLQPQGQFRGVLGAAAASAALKQLRLSKCQLYDDEAAFPAAMAQLPAGLEHLSIAAVQNSDRRTVSFTVFPTTVLQQLQQLTYLELISIQLQGSARHHPALQSLQPLTL
jgi:hypothetical protein